MPSTPPRLRVQRYVLAGVSFVNAISNAVIWEVDQHVSVRTAIHEISRRAGMGIGQVRLFNDREPLNFKEDIDDPVISVVLLSE